MRNQRAAARRGVPRSPFQPARLLCAPPRRGKYERWNFILSDQDFDLAELLVHAEWLLHRYQHLSRRMHGPMGDPHQGQGRILALLKMKPEISQKELSYLLDMRPQSLGELLAKLERSGYIARTASEDDRRRMQIRLTEAGKKASEQSSDIDELFGCLDAEEQAAFAEFLDRIIGALEEKLDKAEEQDREEGPEGREGHGGCDGRDGGPEGWHHGPHHGFPHHGPHGRFGGWGGWDGWNRGGPEGPDDGNDGGDGAPV